MTTRREAIMTAATALATAICDAMGLPSTVEPAPEPTPAPTSEFGPFTPPTIALPRLDDVMEVDVTWSTQKPSETFTGFGPRHIQNAGTLFELGYSKSPAHGAGFQDVQVDAGALLVKAAHCKDMRMERVNFDFGKQHVNHRGICRLYGLIGHTVIKDVRWIGDPAVGDTNSIMAMILLGGKPRYLPDGSDAGNTEENIDVEYGGGTFEIDGFDLQNSLINDPSYPNTDGISIERVFSGTISNGRCVNVMDACFDLKGDIRAHNIYASQARNGIKFWQNQHHGSVMLGTFRHACIMAGKYMWDSDRKITFDYLVLEDPFTPLLGSDSYAAHVVINAGEWSPEQIWFANDCASGSTVTLPDGTVLSN